MHTNVVLQIFQELERILKSGMFFQVMQSTHHSIYRKL